MPGSPVIHEPVIPGDCSLTVYFAPPGKSFFNKWFGEMTNIRGYVIRINPGNRGIPATSSPCTIPGLKNGEAYRVSVLAVNEFGRGEWSKESEEVIPGW